MPLILPGTREDAMAKRRWMVGILLVTVLVGSPFVPRSPAQMPVSQAAGKAERTFWYFYRVKWGFQEEFQNLFQRNHYPILKAQLGGRIKAVKVYVPTYHGDGRADWTFAVEITFKDINAFFDASGQDALIRKLYPDQAKFQKEEQRRFEILDAHWDVALNEVAIE
jgi:hypothetical protein